MKNLYLDANLSQYVAQALNLLNKKDFKNFHVYSTKDKFKEDAKDEEIIPAIGNEEGALITCDYSIYNNISQNELCRQYKTSVFYIQPSEKHFKHWDIVRLLIKHWEEMMKIISTKPHPYYYLLPIRGNKLKELK